MKKIILQIILIVLSFGLSFVSTSIKGSQLEERCEMQCVDFAMVQVAGWPISFKEKAVTYEGTENYKLEDFNKFDAGLHMLNVLFLFIFLNGLVNISNEIYKVLWIKK
ncbi:MAG TPA: hypothetical protein DEB09_01040 [Candidatus Magasanikbacteria bacterium]|nr:hypothetical protein [Candidatus Magasanikbacteria bacterium]